MGKGRGLKIGLAIATLVGGLEHVGASYDMFSLLSMFPASASPVVQLAAGAGGVVLAVMTFMKK
jgi:hypothetical protein